MRIRKIARSGVLAGGVARPFAIVPSCSCRPGQEVQARSSSTCLEKALKDNEANQQEDYTTFNNGRRQLPQGHEPRWCPQVSEIVWGAARVRRSSPSC